MTIQATYIDLNLFNPRSLLQAEQGSVFSFHPLKLKHLSICHSIIQVKVFGASVTSAKTSYNLHKQTQKQKQSARLFSILVCFDHDKSS